MVKARDIYEEGLAKVLTVRDFTQIFDAYLQFEESLINNLMEQANEEGLDEDGRARLLLAGHWCASDSVHFWCCFAPL